MFLSAKLVIVVQYAIGAWFGGWEVQYAAGWELLNQCFKNEHNEVLSLND
jgi:hypothetical protein